MSDQLNKYLFADQSTRVQHVKLDQTWQAGLQHQAYPECIQNLLGELLAAATLLAGNLKFDGSFILQIQGDGPIALLVVECNSEMQVRATISLREGQEIPADGNLQSLLNASGNGRCVVILMPDQKNGDFAPYQGIDPLEGDTVAEILEAYMRNSEQLDTRLWLSADANRCAGLLLQRLPGQGGNQQLSDTLETWERGLSLASTITHDDLLELEAEQLIHRLFWQENLTSYEPQDVNWHCPCSRERVADMLKMLGSAEIEDILTTQDLVHVACNFCGKPYEFDAIDCAALFIEPEHLPSSNTLH